MTLDVKAFSPAAAAELAGPEWLRARRAAAAERAAGSSLPTTTLEEWRYGRIDDLDLEQYAPVSGEHAPAPGSAPHLGAALAALAAMGPSVGHARSVDGFLAGIEVRDGSGLRAARATSLSEAPTPLGELVAPHDDALLAIAEAFVPDVLVIDVPAGIRVSEPFVIVHEQVLPETPDGRRPAAFPRTVVRLGEGAKASIVEIVVSAPGKRLVVPVTEIELADDAHLDHHVLQDLGRDAWQLGYQASRLGRDASFTSFVAALGGDYARQLTRSSLEGAGGVSRLLAVYLGDREQMQDLRTFQEHIAPHTRSELIFKGAVGDKARSVYTGLIGMRKGARRAEASQVNRNLVLSEGAHADSVPNLDIEENDVRCSHASAVGPIDPDLVFYLESRGVPPAAARRLVLLGFFDDLLAAVPLDAAAAFVRESVATRLAELPVLLEDPS